jgi:hypothetical protein
MSASAERLTDGYALGFSACGARRRQHLFFGFRNKEQRTQKKNKNKKQTPFPAFFFVCVRAQLFSLFFFSWNE